MTPRGCLYGMDYLFRAESPRGPACDRRIGNNDLRFTHGCGADRLVSRGIGYDAQYHLQWSVKLSMAFDTGNQVATLPMAGLTYAMISMLVMTMSLPSKQPNCNTFE